MSLYLFQSIKTDFRSVETHFKKSYLNCSNKLFQNFSKLFSLSPTWQGSTKIFLSFSSKFLARFFSPQAGMSILPFVLHCFSHFHALSHGFWVIFELCIIWDFCLIKPCFMNLINGICCYNDVFMIYIG